MSICGYSRGFHRRAGFKYNKRKRLADVARGVFILGTCRCVLLATQLLAAFEINIRSFDQCPEYDLLKFVQNQMDVGVKKYCRIA